jgi:two-component system copper resistance phosphate regulon response regulator CusR
MRILLIEDEERVSRFLLRGLREEGFAVDVAADGADGAQRALDRVHDLIVLDVLMPEKDGFQVLREIRTAGVKARVLMLTARDSIEDRVRGLEGGADDYLIKPFAFAEFLARVRSLLRRDSAVPAVLELSGLRLDTARRKVTRDGQSVPLTVKETAVLEFLLRHRGEVVTRTRLAEAVWDENFDPMSNTIDVTVYHLREKVDRGFHPPLIHTVRGRGYLLSPDGP